MPDLQRGVFPVTMDDPIASPGSQPFWDAALEGRLVAPRCIACATFLLPPQPICFVCQGTYLTWVELSGSGTIYTYTVVRHPLAPSLVAVVPYVSAVVELDGTQGAGARLLVNVVDCDPDLVRVGDRVQVRFDRISATFAVPRFVKIEATPRPGVVR